MASIWEKTTSVFSGNMNSGRSYLNTAVVHMYYVPDNKDQPIKSKNHALIKGKKCFIPDIVEGIWNTVQCTVTRLIKTEDEQKWPLK